MDKPTIVFTIALLLVGVWLSIVSILLFGYIAKRKRLLGDPSIDQLEVLLSEVLERIERLERGHRHLTQASDAAHTLLETSLVSPHVVRYNAYDDISGSQSFSIALLDRRRSGLLVTSLVGREGGRLYIKPVQDGASEAQLSDEETLVLQQTLASLDAPPSHPHH